MKEKIIARIKALFSGVNLSKERMDAIADKLSARITEEDQIDEQLNGLNEVVSFEDIAKQDDRIRNLEKIAKEKQKADPPKTDPPNPNNPPKNDPPKTDDTPEWAKALMGEIASLKADKVKNSRREQVAEKLKEADEKYRDRVLRYFDRMNIESDDDFQTVISEIEADYADHVQSAADAGLGKDQPFGGVSGPSNNKVSEKEVESIVDSL